MTVIHHPATSLEFAEIFERIGSIGWIWFIFFFLWFAWLYTQKPAIRFFKPFIMLFSFIPFILNYQQLVNSAIISEHQHRVWGWFSLWSTSFWMYLYLVYYNVSIAIGLYFIISAMKKSDNRTFKYQSHIILITGLLSMILGSVINVIVPIFFPQLALPVADISVLIWAFGLAYAAVKYRLLDITPFIAAGRIIEVMNDLLFLLDLHGRIISVNNAAIKSLACSENKLVGYAFNELIFQQESEYSGILNIVNETSSSSLEFVMTVPPGPKIPVTLSASLIPGSGIVCVAHDISLQKLRTESLHNAKKMLEIEVSQATAELQRTNQLLTKEIADHKHSAQSLMETEERFRVIFENAPDGIYLANKGGTLLDANREALRISGLEKVDIIGQRIDQLMLHAGPLKEVGASSSSEIVIKRLDGISLPIEISTHLVKIGGQEMSLGVVRDLSQHKKAEAEAEQLKAELHQAQKMEAIGQLAGGIAHDFNNMLAGIMGYAGLLQRQLETQNPNAAEKATKIQNVAHQAKDRIAQLLAFARKGKYRVELVDMHFIIDEVINLLEHTIDKKIMLKRNFSAKRSIISGDRSQLYSAILNLSVNARDALPNGGLISFSTGQIEITTETVKDYQYTIQPGTFLEIKVQDNGIGMDEAKRARVFEPFFSTKDIGKGTGLGCASVYGTVKNHNGFIELESAPCKGSTFTVCLPLSNEKLPEKTVQLIPEEHLPGKGSILIVDDVPFIREVFSEVLKAEGYNIQECSDGLEAVEWLRANVDKCDLIILDLTMPKLSGRECFEALKEINPSLKIIITSGHAMDSEIREILNGGAIAFVQKPSESEVLVEAVRNALE